MSNRSNPGPIRPGKGSEGNAGSSSATSPAAGDFASSNPETGLAQWLSRGPGAQLLRGEIELASNLTANLLKAPLDEGGGVRRWIAFRS